MKSLSCSIFRGLFTSLVIALMCPVISYASDNAEQSPVLKINYLGEKLDLESRNITLGVLLQGLARECHFKVVSEVALDAPVNLEIKELSLHQAMQRILRGKSYALSYPVHDREIKSIKRYGLLKIISTNNEKSIKHKDNNKINRIEALEKILLSGNTKQKIDVLSELVTIRNNEAIRVMAHGLYDPLPVIKEEAIEALGDTGKQAAIAHLQPVLLAKSENIQDLAIEAIAKIGGNEAVNSLQLLLNNQAESVRLKLVYALDEMNNTQAHLLLNKLTQDENASVSKAAEESLVNVAF